MVAIYLENLSIVLPVKPVGRIERLTPQDKKRERSRQERPSFAAMLDAMTRVEDPEEMPQFNLLA